MDGIIELAKLFKDRDNKPYLGPQIGRVISPPPNIQVSLGEKIILTKSHLIIGAHLLGDYEREIEIKGDIELADQEGYMDLEDTPPAITYTVSEGNIGGSATIMGRMKYRDTLRGGDEVILIPSTDEQKYFLVDKGVRL